MRAVKFFAKWLILFFVWMAFLILLIRLISLAGAEHIAPGVIPRNARSFYIAVVPGSNGQPFAVTSLHDMGNEPGSFHLPHDKDEFRVSPNYLYRYTVLERNGPSQLVEVYTHDGDYDHWSRYQVSTNQITPLYSRVTGSGTGMAAFPFAVLATFLSWSATLRLYRRFAKHSKMKTPSRETR